MMNPTHGEQAMEGGDPFEGLEVSRERPNILAVKTLDFALAVIALHGKLAPRGAAKVIGDQLLRSGTSVGAQYHEACRSRSRAEFISKLESALQEVNESLYWLELLSRASLATASDIANLRSTCNEIMSLMVRSVRTLKSRAGK